MSASPPELLAIDTSVSVPLLVRNHPDHDAVMQWGRDHTLALCGHAGVETYSVLTRLPGDLLTEPRDAVLVLHQRFGETLPLPADLTRQLPQIFADARIFGGAVYDGLVALAALHHELPLATRDRRAIPTYAALGVRVITVM